MVVGKRTQRNFSKLKTNLVYSQVHAIDKPQCTENIKSSDEKTLFVMQEKVEATTDFFNMISLEKFGHFEKLMLIVQSYKAFIKNVLISKIELAALYVEFGNYYE